MEFYINKHSTLPILKLELIQDGRNDFHKFFEKIQNANITFTMSNVITGVKTVYKITGTQLVTPPNCVGDEYYIIYQFTKKDTREAGRFVGKFIIDFLDDTGTLIVPIRETLFINVLDQGIMK